MYKGIVRHIDGLGRIVIPKEMRRTMKIGENDALEISETAEGLVLKKHSTLQHNVKMVEKLCKALKHFTDKAVCVCDKSSVIFTDGCGELKGGIVSESLKTIIEGRKTVYEPASGIKIVENKDYLYQGALVAPINFYGELYGAILIFGSAAAPLDALDRRQCELVAEIFSRLIDD